MDINRQKFEYIIKEMDKELPVKELLQRNFKFSSRLIIKLKTNNCVFRNGVPVKMNEKGHCTGDSLTVFMPEETSSFEPENIPVSVVYEDDDLLIINKQPGYVVHPTKGHPCHTMANGIMKYMLDQNQQYKIRFINRLDMDTSGLMAIAKNSYCQDDLARQMNENNVIKKYFAIVKGMIAEERGTIDLPIDKLYEEQVKRAVKPSGYPSITHYRILERFQSGYTMLELLLETGRTHQIRVHLSHIGHPIVGDVLYGSASVWLIERQALHASYFSFRHPVTNKFMEFEAPLPEDIKLLIKKINSDKKCETDVY
ncbi:MAG: RluA family pseudouridine synthase [Eubacteriales bacterium]|nr:RluA family pseudouridine synthase [Eubacteriales bacterium]